jgi:hypothetical protein
MRKRTIALGLAAALLIVGGGWYSSLDKETRGLQAAMPTDRDVLMWKQDQRDAAFRAMDRLPVLGARRSTSRCRGWLMRGARTGRLGAWPIKPVSEF